jgi:hypothetical protein
MTWAARLLAPSLNATPHRRSALVLVLVLVLVETGLPGSGQEKVMDVWNGGSWQFGFNMAGDIAHALVQSREAVFVEHILKRPDVGVLDPAHAGASGRDLSGATGGVAPLSALVPAAGDRLHQWPNVTTERAQPRRLSLLSRTKPVGRAISVRFGGRRSTTTQTRTTAPDP